MNNQSYTIPIIKFILNIIFFVDNYNCNLNTLTILAPLIIFDERILPDINYIFSKIDINNNNQNLKELNLQFQLYKIINIKNIIPTGLIILNIGDLDYITFKCLIKYLTSYNFSTKSHLEKIGIRLNKTINSFFTEIKLALRELFYIKMSNLSELNIYSNIMLKNEAEFKDLVKIIKDNFISNYEIIFNQKSNQLIEKFVDLLKELSYFDTKKSINVDDNKIFWYLIYIFTIRYKYYLLNFASIKECINSIFKFIYAKNSINYYTRKFNYFFIKIFLKKEDKKL